MAPPAGPMQAQAAKGVGVPVAMQRKETSGRAALQLRSPALRNNEPIAPKYSEYHDGLSPPIAWNAVPDAKSYVLIMEDADSKPITPFVHWVAWNIPADVTSLPKACRNRCG